MALSPSTRQPSQGIIVGAGAQGRVALVIWRRADPTRKILFLDDNPDLWGSEVAGCRVVGGIQEVASFGSQGAAAIIAIGNNFTRTEIGRKLSALISLHNVVDPSAVIMPDADMGKGILVGPQAVIHTGARIGDHALINTAAIVEHDCVLEEGSALSPGVRMAGRVHVGPQAFLSTGVTVIGRVRIGEGAIIGAGAVVVSDIPPRMVAHGVPARVIREVSPADWKRLF